MLRIATLICLIAIPATADELPNVLEVTRQIEGREVTVTGDLEADSDPSISSEAGWYPVIFALDREQLARLSECRGYGSSCPVTVSAEIDVDGGLISLIVFDVQHH